MRKTFRFQKLVKLLVNSLRGKLVIKSCLVVILLMGVNSAFHNTSAVNAIDRTGWAWDETELVSFESDEISMDPVAAVDSEDNLHVVWADVTGYNIYYSMKDAISGSWSSMELVSVGSINFASSPSIAIDKDDNIHVVWDDNTDFYGTSGSDYDICYSMKAADSSSWTSVEVISTESTDYSLRPDIACDGEGNLHVVYYDYTEYMSCGSDHDIFYKKWYASTSSWGVAEVVSTESDGDSFCPEICVTLDEHIFVVWYDQSDYDNSGTDLDIFFKQKKPSEDWSSTTVLSWLSYDSSQFPQIECEETGRVHVVWEDDSNILNSGADTDIFYSIYAPNLNSWTSNLVLSSASLLDSHNPWIAIDCFGDVHVVWSDATPIGSSGSDTDIIYKILDSDSLTWSQDLVVSTECNDDSAKPAIITDSTGYTHVFWEDRTDILGAGGEGDVFYTRLFGTITEETDEPTGLFQNLNVGEIIIFAAIVGGFQIILALITYVLLRKRK